MVDPRLRRSVFSQNVRGARRPEQSNGCNFFLVRQAQRGRKDPRRKTLPKSSWEGGGGALKGTLAQTGGLRRECLWSCGNLDRGSGKDGHYLLHAYAATIYVKMLTAFVTSYGVSFPLAGRKVHPAIVQVHKSAIVSVSLCILWMGMCGMSAWP